MNSKRNGKWVIVLFLLATLPGMTAVMAQGEEPATQEPVTPADSMSPDAADFCPYVPMELNVFYQGNPIKKKLVISRPTLVYLESFRFKVFRFSGKNTGAIEDINLQGQGDLRKFYNLSPDVYCIDTYPSAVMGSTSLLVADPVLVSMAAKGLRDGGMVGGVRFFSEDILAHIDIVNPDPAKGIPDDLWRMIFDGSDVGLSANVTNIAVAGGLKPRLMMSFAANQTLPDVGLVTPHDYVYFVATQIGEETSGTFEMGLRGSQYELTETSEILDAIDGWTNGFDRCYGPPISTTGVAIVTGWIGELKQDDEDVFCKVYDSSAGGWRPYDWFFDIKGKNNAPASEPKPGIVPGLSGEDVIAIAYNDDRDRMFLTIQGTGTIYNHPVSQSDIFAINYPTYSWAGIHWNGPEHGLEAKYKIDAIELNGW